MSKGVFGLGCSYTWGEGLYYNSELDDLPFNSYHNFDPSKITPAMMAYKDKNKFTNLVAEYLNTWSWTNRGNGGSILGTVDDYIKNQFYDRDKFRTNDFKLLIYQFTEQYRDFHPNTKFKNIDELIKLQIKKIDELCTEFESNGVKVVTFSWFEEIPNHSDYIKLFKDRHIDIQINNEIKSGFDYFIRNDKYNITIQSDFKKNGLQKDDLHFNKKGHRIIADLIIKKLQQDNFKI